MKLKITSTEKIEFEGEIKKVVLPTEDGEVGVFPGHIPLSTVIKPGVVRFIPTNHESNSFIKSGDFIFENDELNIAVGKGLSFIDGDSVLLVTSSVTSNVDQSREDIIKTKEELENKLEELKTNGSVEEVEKTIASLEKTNAELKLQQKQNS